MKGMIFAGCSFTWGQGLYYYSDLPNLPQPVQYEYDAHLLHHSHLRYKDVHRFPRLVANHFGSFEIVKKKNGGQDDEGIKFIDALFGINNYKDELLTDEAYDFDEISYVIFQTTQPYRNEFHFDFDVHKFENDIKKDPKVQKDITKNGYAKISLTSHDMAQNRTLYNMFFDYLDRNHLSLDEFKNQFLINSIKRIINKLKFLESNGVKTLILSWEPFYLPFIKSNEWTSERMIRLKYNEKEYETISDLISDNSLTIESDSIFLKPIKDLHPSKKCHRIIANSIIDKIENG